jgi:queuosine precursor transporter
MSNLMVFLIFAVVNFALITTVYRLWGKQGILGYIVLSVIAANLQVNKGVVFDFGLFQLEATLGNVMFSGIFLATDLLSEKYGPKSARNAVHISIFANIAFVGLMFIATLFKGMDYSSSYNSALDLFFAINGGALKAVLIGNLVYFISQSLDVFVYSKIKSWSSTRKTLWIRNNGSTLISQLVDTLLCTIGFGLAGIFPMEIAGSIIITTLIVKYLAALMDTPFLYIMSFVSPREKVAFQEVA